MTFNCGGAATITVTSTKTIRADTTIDGGSVITISGSGPRYGETFGVFGVNSGATFKVQNLTIANTYNSTGDGGAIYNGGTLTVTNSTFSSNIGGDGDAIRNDGTLTVTNCTFSGNSADNSGAIFNDGTLTATNSTFSGNSVDGAGGGVIQNVGSMATVTDCTFSNNSASGSGIGAGYGGAILNDGTLIVTNCTFSDNRASQTANSAIEGGAIINSPPPTARRGNK